MPRLAKKNQLPDIPEFAMRDEDKFPKLIGSVVDLYYETKQRRLALAKVVVQLQKQETWLKDFVIDDVPKSDATGAMGAIAKAQVVMKSRVQVQDWDKFYKYIFRVKRPELLQRRPNEAAIKELWDDKKTVPGVGEFEFKDVSLTKL